MDGSLHRKKVVILTRAFPPAAKTASLRPLAWARYLHEYGYYPVIITRNWDREQQREEDSRLPSGTTLKTEIHEHYEVHYVPFKGALSDAFRDKYQGKYKVCLKFLSVFQAWFGNLTPFYHNRTILSFLLKYLRENRDVRKMIVTAPPFDFFGIAHKTQRGNPDLKWVADYRDEWTTSTIRELPDTSKLPVWYRLAHYVQPKERSNELKWLNSAAHISIISEEAKIRIQGIFRDKKISVVPNGFFEEDFQVEDTASNKLFDELTITYSGWLYPTQQVEVLLEGFRSFIDAAVEKNPKIRLLFIGGNYFPGMRKRIMKELSGYENYVTITDRVSRSEAISMQMKSHVLFLSAHTGENGIPSSKLYEYMATGKPVLLCPTDKGVLEETLKSSGQAIVCNTPSDVKLFLEKLTEEFLAGKTPAVNLDKDYVMKFSRRKQAGIIAKILNEI